MRSFPFCILFSIASSVAVSAQAIDWPKVNDEAMRLQALVQIDSTIPGNETRVVEYVKKYSMPRAFPPSSCRRIRRAPI